MIWFFLSLTILFGLFRYLFLRLNTKLWNYFSDGPYGDASTYFFLIQFFRTKSCGVSDPRCLISKESVLVPSLFMKITGKLLSDRILFNSSWIPNLFIHVISVACFLSFIYWNINVNSEVLASILLLFLLQPDNIGLDKHRIQYSVLQPRYFGLIINSFLWLTYIQHGITTESFLLICFLLIVSINTSIFCRQSSLFSILLVSLISFDALLFLTLPVAVLVSIVLFPREFLPSVIPQLKYSYQYFLNYYKPKPSRNFFVHLVKNVIARPVFESYPYFTSFLVLFISGFFMWSATHFTSTEYFTFKRLFTVYSALAVIFIMTGIRKFAFLGECWRYFSYATYFSSAVYLPILIFGLPISYEAKIIFVVLLIIVNIALAVFVSKDLFENKNKYLISLLQASSEELKNAIWYSVPYRTSTLAVALGYGGKTFEYQYGNHSNEIHEMYFSEYPYLKWSEQMLEDNKVSHVLVEREYLDRASEKSGFSLDSLDLVVENQYFSVYRYHSLN
jgi:hypothetical protein